MTIVRKIIACLLALAFSASFVAASETTPSERDRQVLNSLLSFLLTSTNFNLTGVATNGTTVVLHARTPEKTGFLHSSQMRADIAKQILPADAVTDLRERNTPPDAKTNTYPAVAASYTNLTFSTNILVAELSPLWKDRRLLNAFEQAYPQARGYVQSYLPGYSKDGNQAVVRAMVGPTPHGAMLTVLLEKTGDTWTVKWHRLVRFV